MPEDHQSRDPFVALRMDPDRRRAVRLLWETSPKLLVALVVDGLATAVLPISVLVALGVLVGRIPPALGGGLGSPEGGRVVEALVLVAVTFAGAMLSTPVHHALSGATRARLTAALQSRLMEKVSRPAGIAHLEDPAVLDQISLARGALMTWNPADAPAALAAVWSKRLSAVLTCGALAYYQWWLGLLFLVLWPVTRRPLMRVVKDHVTAFGGNVDVMRRAEYYRQLATRPAGAKEIRIFGLGPWIVDRYRSTWEEAMAEVWSIRSGIHRVVRRVAVVLTVAYVGAAAYIAWAAWNGDLDLQAVAIMLPALGLTLTSGAMDFDDIALEWMLSALPHLDEVEGEVDRAGRTLDGEVDAGRRPETEVRFEHVAFAYPGAADDPVFDGLDLTLVAGTSTAIVGVNGAGKTTLVKLLARLHDPTAGRITVDGTDLATIAPASWRRRIAVVFQDFLRLPLSAGDNVGLGAVAHLADVEGRGDVADQVGLTTTIDALPLAWATTLSPQFTDGTDLSGGQWQRLALARALFAARHGASVLVLDEPTAWMDVRSEAEVFDRFLAMTQGLTTVVISHRFSTVRQADRICVLAGGRVVEQGTHDALLAAGGDYARMFRLQAERFADEPQHEVADGARPEPEPAP